MNGGKKFFIIIIVVILFAGLGFASWKLITNGKPVVTPSGDNVNPNENTSDNLADKVQVETITVKNKTDNIFIENYYPAIRSFKDKEFESSINKKIAENISDYRTEINYMVDDLTSDVTLYKYTTNYTKNAWGDYLTLIVNQDYQTGGIRSNTWKEIYNINARTERLMYLEELFEATTDYEKAIIDEITSQANIKNYKLMGGEGISSIPAKQKFYIQDGKLHIYFDPSEIAAATYGELDFEMPFTLYDKGFFEVK